MSVKETVKQGFEAKRDEALAKDEPTAIALVNQYQYARTMASVLPLLRKLVCIPRASYQHQKVTWAKDDKLALSRDNREAV